MFRRALNVEELTTFLASPGMARILPCLLGTPENVCSNDDLSKSNN